jgi:hypothetical protein
LNLFALDNTSRKIIIVQISTMPISKPLVVSLKVSRLTKLISSIFVVKKIIRKKIAFSTLWYLTASEYPNGTPIIKVEKKTMYLREDNAAVIALAQPEMSNIFPIRNSFGRYSNSYPHIRDITQHNSICSDSGIIPNLQTAQYLCSSADFHVIPD